MAWFGASNRTDSSVVFNNEGRKKCAWQYPKKDREAPAAAFWSSEWTYLLRRGTPTEWILPTADLRITSNLQGLVCTFWYKVFIPRWLHVCIRLFLLLKLWAFLISSPYDHHWLQVCSLLGLCQQSRQYLKVHYILCVLLLEQRMVKVAKSYSRKEMILDKTNW